MEQVSIVIPVYNTPEEYFHECMKSVLGQTFQNFEVILSDDGSSNGIEKVCDDYAEKDNRIRVIHHENQGLPGARNRGTEFASGTLLIYLDPDDWWEQDTLETAVRKIGESGADVLIFSYIDNFADRSQKKRRIWREEHPECVLLDERQKEKLRIGLLDDTSGDTPGCFGSACMQIAKLDFIRSYGICFKEYLRKTEDLLYELELLKKSCKIAVLDKAFYHYRHHGESICNRYNKDITEISNEVNRELENLLSEEGKEYRYALRIYTMKSYINILRQDYFHPDNTEPWRIRRKSWKKFVHDPGSFSELKSGNVREMYKKRKLYGLIFMASFRIKSFFLLHCLYRLFSDRL